MAEYKCGDTVFFYLNNKKYEYSVTSNFLVNCLGDNAQIFTDLGMDEQAKMDFCSKAFGYPARSGRCPCSRVNDYEALSRLIEAIEAKCKKGRTYKFDDRVIFTVDGKDYKYTVEDAWLSNSDGRNDEIFDVLGLDANEFCSKAYGYPAEGGSWPECHDRDLDALNRAIKALREEIAKRSAKITGGAEATTEDIKTLAELKSKLDKERLLDRVPSITKDLLYSNLSRITNGVSVVFTLKDKTLHYTFNSLWLAIKGSVDGENAILFKKLGIKDIAKDLATACYGYKAGGGAWPDYQMNDKKALLRFLYVLSKEYDVKISIDSIPLGSYVWRSLTGCASKLEPYEGDTIASKAACTEHSFYDAEVLAFQATTLVDRSKLLNHRSPEISLTINHFSLKF